MWHICDHLPSNVRWQFVRAAIISELMNLYVYFLHIGVDVGFYRLHNLGTLHKWKLDFMCQSAV
jgi:hypothetical protein